MTSDRAAVNVISDVHEPLEPLKHVSACSSDSLVVDRTEEKDMGQVSQNPESHMSIVAASMFPGFKFSPTDVELISYYLKQKIDGLDKSVEVIPEVEICRYEPWDLPGKAVIQSDSEWFFFSHRGRKYPNGSQSKRATEFGYWKATGKERNVKSNMSVIGTKRTLVFHLGRAPKGQRTEWIMHEYCKHGTNSQDPLVVCRLRRNNEFRVNGSSHQNQESGCQQTLSMTSNNTNQQNTNLVGNYDIVVNNGGKVDDGNSGKCSSSHDSYSIEQNGDALESDQQVPHDASQWNDGIESADVPHGLSQSGSSFCNQGFDNDDFYADILNDDIVKLFDESSLMISPSSQGIVSNRTELCHKKEATTPIVLSQRTGSRTEPHHANVATPAMVTTQGIARRRIRLDTTKVDFDAMEVHLNSPKKQSIFSKLAPGRFSGMVLIILLTIATLSALFQ